MGYAFPSPGSETVDAPTATLEEVDIRSELAARPHRSPNYADDFLATLGHELRNPFAAVVTAASILQKRITTDGTATRAIEVIVRQCQHASRLVEDLLDIARIRSGKLQLEMTTVDLRAIVADAVEARRFQIERRRHLLTVDLGSDPVCWKQTPSGWRRSCRT